MPFELGFALSSMLESKMKRNGEGKRGKEGQKRKKTKRGRRESDKWRERELGRLE